MTEIIKADVSDLSEILALQKLAYEEEAKLYEDNSIPPMVQTLEEIKEEYTNSFFLKAVMSQRIIGSVRAHTSKGTGYIGRLIVHPDFQNQGIGTRLMHAIESHDAETIRFELFTGKKSGKNIRFYKKLGYKLFGEKEINRKLTLVYLRKEK